MCCFKTQAVVNVLFWITSVNVLFRKADSADYLAAVAAAAFQQRFAPPNSENKHYCDVWGPFLSCDNDCIINTQAYL